MGSGHIRRYEIFKKITRQGDEERRGVFTGFWWGNMKEGDHLGDLSLDGRIILRRVFRK
jgi:hypothetical protein